MLSAHALCTPNKGSWDLVSNSQKSEGPEALFSRMSTEITTQNLELKSRTREKRRRSGQRVFLERRMGRRERVPGTGAGDGVVYRGIRKRLLCKCAGELKALPCLNNCNVLGNQKYALFSCSCVGIGCETRAPLPLQHWNVEPAVGASFTQKHTRSVHAADSSVSMCLISDFRARIKRR